MYATSLSTPLTIKASSFQYNTIITANANSAAYGGGLHVANTTLTLHDCSIVENQIWAKGSRIDAYGGGLYHVGASLKMVGVEAASNVIRQKNATSPNINTAKGGGKTLTTNIDIYSLFCMESC